MTEEWTEDRAEVHPDKARDEQAPGDRPVGDPGTAPGGAGPEEAVPGEMPPAPAGASGEAAPGVAAPAGAEAVPPVLPEPAQLPVAEEEATPPAAPAPAGAGAAWYRWRLLLMGGLAVPAGMVALGVALAWVLRRERLLTALRLDQPWPKVLAWAALGAAASLGVTTGLAQVWPRFGQALERVGVETGEEVLRMAGWLVLAVVVAGAGLGEETFFRGGLQPSLGIPLSSLAFGLAHGGWRLREMWSYVLAAALAGAIFGFIYAHTGYLWAAVLAHAGHNLLVTLYLLHRQRRSQPAAT